MHGVSSEPTSPKKIGEKLNQEIWLAQMETKTVASVGRQKDVEAGKIDKAAALLIAESEGKALLVVDGHQAQHMVYKHHFKDRR